MSAFERLNAADLGEARRDSTAEAAEARRGGHPSAADGSRSSGTGAANRFPDCPLRNSASSAV